MLRELINGANILREWLGQGGVPVSPEQAQNRADICTRGFDGQPCPNNVQGFKFTEVAAEAIREYTEAKNSLELRVVGEDGLHSCQICKCHLPLKVHVPFIHIYNHTGDEIFSKFPSQCWLKKELNTPA